MTTRPPDAGPPTGPVPVSEVQYAVLAALIEHATMADAAPAMLAAICDALGFEVGAVWVVEDDAAQIRSVGIWARDPVATADFLHATRSSAFVIGEGLPGRVWKSGLPVVIGEVAHDENFPRREVARRVGLHGAFAFPITAEGRVLGVLEGFSIRERTPDPDILRAMQAAGRQVGLALVRERLARVQAETAARFRGILASALDCVITIDQKGRILDFSPAAEQTFGFRRDDILGRIMADHIVPPRYREAHRRGLAHYLVTGEGPVLGRRIEISAVRANGEEFPAELAITPVRLAGGQEVFTAFLRDITERKRAEAEVQEARVAAERSAAAKDQFLANVSHELRTPLNAIVGLAHLLNRTSLDAGQVRSVDGIRFAADALLTVINDLIDLSRIRTGRLTFETVPFELRSLLDGLVNSVAASAHDRGLSLTLKVDADVPEVVSGDPGRLNQVLLNLVGNALRFTEHGGITVRVSRDPSGGEAGAVRFSVIDTGIGIAPEDQDRIFEAFEQASAEISKRHGGSGLGLAIVKELVQQQGGTVSVESTPGAGSAFHISLPFALAGESPVVNSVAASPTLLRGARLLLVEDNEMNRYVASQVLEGAGAQVTIATNGREALACVSAQAFDLVLMDIQMPEMDGFEAAWRIRHELGIPESRLPIVALTATALTDEQRRAEASGMSDFILKPFRPELLCQRVAGIIAGIAPGGPMAPAGHVNQRSLEENTLHQAAFTRQVLEIFLRSVPVEIERLEAAIAAADCEGIGALAHQMKSQAGTIGAEGLQRAMQGVEKSVRGVAGLTPALARAASDAARLGRDVLAEVRELMAQYTGPAR